ncbi:hypothetical protein V2J09_005248 [Rumex salicifolius]
MDAMETNPQQQAGPEGGPRNFPAKTLNKLKENLTFRSKWAEINGAMGDLGTYIPIVLALTLAKDLNLGTTLLFTGVYNILTGALYGVPMPVQPMKSIAAVALSTPSFNIPEVMAAGIGTSAVLLLLGATRLMDLVYRLVPLPVVRGIQLSQGLSFAITAVKYVQKTQNFAASKSAAAHPRPWLGLDGILLALLCGLFIIIVNGAGEEAGERDCDLEGRARRGKRLTSSIRKILFSVPSALLIFLLGVALAFARGPPKEITRGFKFGPSPFHITNISKESWKQGFIKGTIPQLPLSILNSVIAVVKLSSDLFPGRGEFSATSVATTVGAMNLVGCWFGAMPCCHGAGGLAGQYKFGGRSGGCVALLGGTKMVIGVVLGSSIVRVLERFPVGVLGVLLLFAGIELAMAAKDMNTKEEAFVMLICTAVSLVGSGASLGFLSGMVVHLLLKIRHEDMEYHHVALTSLHEDMEYLNYNHIVLYSSDIVDGY